MPVKLDNDGIEEIIEVELIEEEEVAPTSLAKIVRQMVDAMQLTWLFASMK